MKPLSETDNPLPASIHHFDDLYDVKIPIPAFQRGWLHSRKLRLPWHIERIIEKIGDKCWFSRYHRENRDPDPDGIKFRPYAIAGFWPSGGFVELELAYANPLDDHPRGALEVHAESPERAEALMNELIEGYRHEAAPSALEPRIGILNSTARGLDVERIPVTIKQTVPREQLDLYYGEGVASWVNEWLRALNSRRYGLTLLTGDPGTGKTTLVRSLAHWLAASHMFYFMPAARFASVESGEIVTFLTSENRNSNLRKILILEDAESILQRRGADNREKVATLLNLTDGLLGDALGLHVICTLNSDLTDLDPALLRPGRLIAHREFRALTPDEAGHLAKALGLDAPAAAPVSLAELFNPASSKSISPCSPRRVMGFHAALPSHYVAPPMQARPAADLEHASASEVEPSEQSVAVTQDDLSFGLEVESRGYFDETDRNLYDGQDLDVPTYLRKGIKISL
ncbi:MAG TPA: AAA family ATPase [Opitutaceae bacterium]|nr:AAA family ATPase [Opitutaceae bacterium]